MAYITENELGASDGTDAAHTVNSLPAFAQKPQAAPAAATVAKPSALDTVAAAFRVYNTAGTLYDKVAHPYDGSDQFDANFSPRRKAVEEGLAEYADEFTTVKNPEHYEHVKNRVLQQKNARRILEDAGGWGLAAAIPAVIADPVGMALMAVPVAGAGRIAQIGSKAARYGAYAGAITATGIATGVAQTGALQAVNPTPESETVQSLYDINGTGTHIAVGLGLSLALFGTAGRTVHRASRSEVQKAVDALIVDPQGALLQPNATAAQIAAGTAVNDGASKLYENAATKTLGVLADDVSRGVFDGIGLKLAKSPFDAFRKLGQQLSPDIMQRVGTKDEVASPILNAKLMTMMEGNSDIHAFGNVVLDTKKGLDGLKQLTPAEQQEIFQQMQAIGINAKSIDDITPAAVQAHASELIGYAVATGTRHVIPEIDAAAEKLRAIFTKDWGRIVAQGLDNGVPASMPTYFTRVFNKAGIAMNQVRFIDDLTPHIEQSLIAGGLNPADAALQARTVATAVNNKISGAGVAGTGADMFRAVSESGPMGKLAARTLDVPYAVLAPYMEHDAYKVLNIYKRSVEPQIALKEVFGHTTFEDFNEHVLMVERDRVKAALIASADGVQGDDIKRINSELAGFDKAWDDNTKQLQQLFDGLMGKTKMAERAHTELATSTRIVRKTTGMAMLSGQVLSSIVDIPRQIGTHGITPVMVAWANYLTSGAFRAMGRETAERVGVALELTQFKLNAHGQEAFGGYEREVIGQARGRIEERVDQLAEGFQWLNGAMLWNDSLRTTTAVLAEDRLLRAADKGWTNLSKSDKEWMLVLGIDETQLGGIKAASQGSTQSTRRFMHTDIENWTDLDAARSFKLAVLKDAQTTALTPFTGTMPTWYDSEAGKFIWQFKSFISASYQQTLMVGLQRNDARVWTGLTAMVATGMAISEIKDNFSAGPKKEKSLAERVASGVDRSGAFDMPLALAGYVNAFASDMGMAPNLFSDNNRRPRGILDSLLGPVGTVGEKLAGASREIAENGVTEKAQQDIASVTPYHKIMGVDVARALIDSIHGHTQYIDKVVDAFKQTFEGMYPDE